MTIDEDRLARIEGQLARNERASSDLRASVEALGVPLGTLADIQAEQRDIRARADQAANQAEAAHRVSTARAVRARRSLLLVGVGAVALLLLVTSLTFAGLIAYVRSLMDADLAARYQACVTRNEAVVVQVRRERILADLDRAGFAARAQAHTNSADALQRLLVNCDPARRS